MKENTVGVHQILQTKNDLKKKKLRLYIGETVVIFKNSLNIANT